MATSWFCGVVLRPGVLKPGAAQTPHQRQRQAHKLFCRKLQARTLRGLNTRQLRKLFKPSPPRRLKSVITRRFLPR
ncbi:MAG: hypothetical protein QM537_08330, partial [Candidatus Symbiobacter sp.]|nr:hypothetical protein [Candidatus Symbiobacter sp.]